MKSIDFFTADKADFRELPHISALPKKERVFDSLIIIPEKYKHDSGFMCMSFVGGVREAKRFVDSAEDRM